MLFKKLGRLSILFVSFFLIFASLSLCEASSNPMVDKYIYNGVWKHVRCSTPEYHDVNGKNYGATHGSLRNVPPMMRNAKEYLADIKVISDYMDSLTFEFTYVPDNTRATGNCSKNPNSGTYLLELEFPAAPGRIYEVDTYVLTELKK